MNNYEENHGYEPNVLSEPDWHQDNILRQYAKHLGYADADLMGEDLDLPVDHDEAIAWLEDYVED